MSRTRALTMLLAALLATAAVPAWAAPTGEEIVREADRRQIVKSEFYEGILKVISRKGKIREKGWRYWRLGHGGESRTVIQFTSPAEVAGVGLLTWAHAGRDDEQWMWTPAIRRERRISPQEKSTRFLGTDFTYEDLSERVIEDWEYRLEEEAADCDGAHCWIVASTPRTEKQSQYTRTRLWIRHGDYALMRMEMYAEEELRRELVLSDHREIQGIVTAHRIVIRDLKRGSRTELTTAGVRYGLPFQESFFTVRSLQETHGPPE